MGTAIESFDYCSSTCPVRRLKQFWAGNLGGFHVGARSHVPQPSPERTGSKITVLLNSISAFMRYTIEDDSTCGNNDRWAGTNRKVEHLRRWSKRRSIYVE
jgi:hypothetical protein